jgi:galactokinase
VNLIGEFTDYNAGFALPFAIEQGCTATVERADADEVVVTSAQRGESVRAPASDLSSVAAGWARYPLGVVWAMQQRGLAVPGLRIHLDSTVPLGAGLSSSAALVCSVATAISDLLKLDLSDDELLAVTRAAENEFVRAPTGGLDQLAALRCTAGHALLCDMRSLTVRQVPFDLAGAGLALLVIDTRSSHRHADGEYGARRAACEEAARLLGIAALRDIGVDELAAALARLPDDLLRRCVRHVVTENERVQQTATLLDRDELAAIGPLLTSSHESLRYDYRVTVPELDLAVTTALSAGALGARMTGGGFGGSVIALLPAGRAGTCADEVAAAFERQGFTPPVAFTVEAMPGALRVGTRD